MKKISTVLAFLMVLGPFAMAQAQVDPGFIDAGSSLYGFDVAADGFMVGVGMKSPGDVAHERASEMYRAQEQNQTQAMERAREHLHKRVQQSSENDTQGLEKAHEVLTQLKGKVPEQAKPGIETALGNIDEAKRKKPAEKSEVNDSGKPEDAGAPKTEQVL